MFLKFPLQRISLLTVLVVTPLFLSSEISAQDAIRLFNADGVPVWNYDSVVHTIENNLVTFGDGRTYRVGKKLGGVGASLIFELPDDPSTVLRLSLKSELRPLLASMGDGYIDLKITKAPVTEFREGSVGNIFFSKG